MKHLFLLLVMLWSCCLWAQKPFAKHVWLSESRVPVKVNDLCYAADGYMWLATDEGVYRFNGRSFTMIHDSIAQPVTALSVKNKEVYVGHKNGRIGIVRGTEVIPYHIAHSAPSSAITSIHVKGLFLFVTTEEEGVFVVANHAGWQLTTAQGLADNFVYTALLSDTTLLLATDRGINCVRWNGNTVTVDVVSSLQGLPDNIVRVFKPIPGRKKFLVGTQEGGLALFDAEHSTVRRFRMSTRWAWGQINDILPISAEEAWIGTEEGYLLRGKIFDDSLEITPYAYDDIKITKLVNDKSGNIWCATNKGLLMTTALYAYKLDFPEGYQLQQLTAMTYGEGGYLWFTQNDMLYKWKVDEKTLPEPVIRLPASITCIYADEFHNLWIGTFGKGLFLYSSETLTAVKNVASLAEGHILSVTGIQDHLWISSLNGVEEALIMEGEALLQIVRHHNKSSGTGSDYVYQLYPDRKGRVWMATDGGGVCMFDGTRYHRWNDSAGLKSDVVYCIGEDASGTIWAGTLSQGVFRFTDGRWEQFTVDHGLQDMNVYALAGTGSGEMIVVTEEGIDQFYPKNRQFRHFNRRLGLDIDSTLSIPNCIAKDLDGTVYVPYERGFVAFPASLQSADIRPSITVSSVSLFNKPVAPEKRRFAHDENHISIRYDGMNFSNPERLHYRYKLSNYDTSWIYTSDEIIPFVQLPSGEFTFRVQASLSKNFSSVSEDRYSFIIVKPFWQKSWFVAFASLALLGLGYGYVKIRERNLRKMSRLQKERMMFEYEHLKSQVNPHFLFNSLNTLVSLIEEDRESAMDYTVHLADLYRNMLSYRDRDLISLDEEYEIIRNYMHIQKSRFGEALQLVTNIPEELLRTKRIVPLALQLLVENAIKHNVVSRAQPLTITITADEETIRVSNPIRPKASKEKGAGLGLVNIQKRYELLTKKKTRFAREYNEYVVYLPLL